LRRANNGKPEEEEEEEDAEVEVVVVVVVVAAAKRRETTVTTRAQSLRRRRRRRRRGEASRRVYFEPGAKAKRWIARSRQFPTTIRRNVARFVPRLDSPRSSFRHVALSLRAATLLYIKQEIAGSRGTLTRATSRCLRILAVKVSSV